MPTFAERTLEHADTADMVVFQMQHPQLGVLPVVTDPGLLAFGQVGGTFAMRTALAREIGYMDGHSAHGGARAEDWEMIRPFVIVVAGLWWCLRCSSW